MWDHYKYYPASGWQSREWNAAGVPPLQEFVRQCVARATPPAPTPQPTPPTPTPTPTPPPDDTRVRCDQYARTAVAQNEENLSRRCGYTGSRWQSNYRVHYNWCANTQRNFADSETRIRAEDLRRCRGRTGNSGSTEWNTDRPGGDYRSFDLAQADPQLCRRACSRESRCRAWTYVKPGTIQGPRPRCWLKDRVPVARSHNCCVSGVVR